MKKIIKSMVCILFMMFITNVYAATPASFSFVGKTELKQGETVTYNLTVDVGTDFITTNDEGWTYTIEYDMNVFDFNSFVSDIEGITCENSETACVLTIPKEVSEGYNVGDIIGRITFRVLEGATLGQTNLIEPEKTDEAGEVLQDRTKVITITAITNNEEDREIEENEKEELDDDYKLYISLGSIGAVILSLIICLISVSKKK